MAEDKKVVEEREYIIPLRREWTKAVKYKRTSRSVKAIKEFVAKHMKIPERDVKKVKLDVYLNNELWFKGGKKPPAKIKVKAIRDGEFVKVEFVDVPKHVGFLKSRQDRLHKKTEKKKVVKEEKTETPKEGEEKKPEETEEKKEEKKVEKEKTKAVEKAQEKVAEKAAKAQKHTIKSDKQVIQRKALKK